LKNQKERMAIVAKITSKNQVTIPKPIRNKLGLKSHDKLIFTTNESGQIIIKGAEEKDAFWQKVEEQQQKYGLLDETEMDWGNDVGHEVID